MSYMKKLQTQVDAIVIAGIQDYIHTFAEQAGEDSPAVEELTTLFQEYMKTFSVSNLTKEKAKASGSEDSGTKRAPSEYHVFLKEKTAEFAEKFPNMPASERRAKVSALWKEHKDAASA